MLDGTANAAAGPDASENTPDAYARAADAPPGTSGTSVTDHASDATLSLGSTHSHTRTVNGAEPHGPGTNGVADADVEPSGDGFDRDDDTVSDGVSDADTASDADAPTDGDVDVDAFTDANGASVASGDSLCVRNADGDMDTDELPLTDAEPDTVTAYVGEPETVEPSFLLADARCVPSTE